MSAFLFIPSTIGTGPGRRVNFADIANLFGEAETPVPRRGPAAALRVALSVLILLASIGDLLLVARTEMVASCLASGHGVQRAAVTTHS